MIKDLIKKTFIYSIYYKLYWIPKKKRQEHNFNVANIFFHKEAEQVFHLFCTALNEEHILFWLEFGTLLGYYREHDFISHDCDMDTGAMLSDCEKVRTALKKHGFERVRYYRVVEDGGVEECYKHKDYNTTIDVFYFREDGAHLYCNSFQSIKDMSNPKNLNKDMPFKVKRVDVPNCGYEKAIFKGNDVFVPIDCELYLKAHYGKDFMIPNSSFDSKTDATNITYYTYEEKQGIGTLLIGYY